MKYFHDVKDLNELKERYRQLCRQYHPDLGGNTAIMQEINAEYEHMLKTGEFDFGSSSEGIESSLRSVIEKTVILDGLIVEICGRWLWFTGETRKHKDRLKALGCRWARKKCAWYWRSADEKRKRTKTIPLDKIRAKYGSKVVEKSSLRALA